MNHFVGQISCKCVCGCGGMPSPVCMPCERHQRQQYFAMLSHRSQDSFLPSSLFSRIFLKRHFFFAHHFRIYKCSLVAWYGQGFMSGECIHTVTHGICSGTHTHASHQTIIYFRFTCGKWQVAAPKSKYVWRMSPCVCLYELRLVHARAHPPQ